LHLTRTAGGAKGRKKKAKIKVKRKKDTANDMFLKHRKEQCLKEVRSRVVGSDRKDKNRGEKTGNCGLRRGAKQESGGNL